MPSDPLLDFEALLAPIDDENPAGGPVPYSVREQLEERRKEVDPSDFDSDDPRRPDTPVRADWPGILQLTRQTLSEKSKDLLVAARMTEALAKTHGFVGLRDGVRLLRRLVGECWDRLNPAIESDDELEVRAAPFFWLDDPDRGAVFPISVRMLPMLHVGGKPFGWQHWKQAQGGKGDISMAEFDRTISNIAAEHCVTLVEDLDQCWEDFEALAADLDAKMGQYAPGLSSLRSAINECRALARLILERKGPIAVPGGGGEELAADGTAVAGSGGSVARQMASRSEVYRQLAEAAHVLRQLEPHSPIPYLLHRAVELGGLSFPDLMRELVRDADVLKSMNRELGIKAPPDDDD